MAAHRRRTAGRPLAALVVALLAGSALVGCTAATGEGARRPMAEGTWAVDHRDAFSGATLDAGSWATCYWWEDDGCTNLGNDEAEWYDEDGVRVADGHLSLTAEPARSSHLGRSFSYRSGMVSSGRVGDDPDDPARYAFTYGYVEVRFRTPKGGGLWPAIWMLPVTNRSLPEIDLLEQYGDDTRTMSMTFHPAPGSEAERERGHVTGSDLSEGWHTVGLEWTSGRLRWFLDGTERFTTTGAHVPSEPMYLLVNLAVGGPAGDPPPSTSFPATFLIDEVTVWKQI